MENDKIFCLYQHTRKSDDTIFYIGIGKKNRPYNKYHRSDFWKKITNKHGFNVKILVKNISWERACELEKLMISFYGRINNKTGILCNLTDGGDGVYGLIHSSESKLKMKEKKIGKKHNELSKQKISNSLKGKIVSEQTKKNISNAQKGKIISEQTKKNISNALKGNTIWVGKKHKQESKIKMSNAKIGVNIKSINQYDLNNNLLNNFNSIKSAAISLGLQASHISAVCNGNRKMTGGFIFNFV